MRLVLVGPPGAGKGTQAEFISAHFSVPQISTGDLFRANVGASTPLGVEAKRYMDAGHLVPDEVTVKMVTSRLDESDAARGFLLDGFPRNVTQAGVLDKMLGERDAQLTLVMELRVEPEEVVRRLSGRRTCRGCGKIWHIEFDPTEKPGVCDRCGGELFQRDDDKPETIQRRLHVYAEQTAPLIEFYAGREMLITVDATGPVEDVTERVLTAIHDREG